MQGLNLMSAKTRSETIDLPHRRSRETRQGQHRDHAHRLAPAGASRKDGTVSTMTILPDVSRSCATCGSLDFSINDIRTLLCLADRGGLNCADAKAIALDHLAEIRDKIVDLKKLERALLRMARRATGTSSARARSWKRCRRQFDSRPSGAPPFIRARLSCAVTPAP